MGGSDFLRADLTTYPIGRIASSSRGCLPVGRPEIAVRLLALRPAPGLASASDVRSDQQLACNGRPGATLHIHARNRRISVHGKRYPVPAKIWCSVAMRKVQGYMLPVRDPSMR
jgi:hypothetical protein